MISPKTCAGSKSSFWHLFLKLSKSGFIIFFTMCINKTTILDLNTKQLILYIKIIFL